MSFANSHDEKSMSTILCYHMLPFLAESTQKRYFKVFWFANPISRAPEQSLWLSNGREMACGRRHLKGYGLLQWDRKRANLLWTTWPESHSHNLKWQNRPILYLPMARVTRVLYFLECVSKKRRHRCICRMNSLGKNTTCKHAMMLNKSNEQGQWHLSQQIANKYPTDIYIYIKQIFPSMSVPKPMGSMGPSASQLWWKGLKWVQLHLSLKEIRVCGMRGFCRSVV